MELCSFKSKKWLNFYIFCWCQQKRIFLCIWKILFGSFRKCYELLDSELPLTRYQPMKIQKFINFLLTQLFFYISSLDISQTVTPKSINHSNDHNSRSKHDNQENDRIFFIYSSSSIHWYISFLHFKTFKIQFHEITPLH